MDIGFGNQNQIIGNMVNKVMLEGAEQQEAQLDADMAKYDELMNDEDALERLRAKVGFVGSVCCVWGEGAQPPRTSR